jgi:hypothetical protein
MPSCSSWSIPASGTSSGTSACHTPHMRNTRYQTSDIRGRAESYTQKSTYDTHMKHETSDIRGNAQSHTQKSRHRSCIGHQRQGSIAHMPKPPAGTRRHPYHSQEAPDPLDPGSFSWTPFHSLPPRHSAVNQLEWRL